MPSVQRAYSPSARPSVDVYLRCQCQQPFVARARQLTFHDAAKGGFGQRAGRIRQRAARDEAGNDISRQFEAHTRTIFSLLDKTLRRTGGSLANMVTMTVFINDPRHGDKFVELRKGFFPDGNFPASALITVSHFARPGMLISVGVVTPLCGPGPLPTCSKKSQPYPSTLPSARCRSAWQPLSMSTSTTGGPGGSGICVGTGTEAGPL